MSGVRRRHKKHQGRNRVTRITKEGLVLVIAFLLAIILVLLFKVADVLLPLWMIEYRNQIEGILLFIVILLSLLSPIIVEFDTNPRVFSGPGKDPRQGWGP
jgi:hypothetical protein